MVMLRALFLFLMAPAAMASDIGDPEAGQEVFDYCVGCHEVGQGAENGIGPHLNGLFGRKATSVEGYRYSDSLSRAGAGGLEWHADTLHVFLQDPTSIASNTRMSIDGLEDATERADLLAFLRQFSDNPADIPEADPTARATDHDLDPAILAIQGDPEYGEYLSSECTTCHQADGSNDGIPSITYWPEEQFVIAMHAYRSKRRAHPVMQMMAARLNDEEIAALAAYFANIE